MNHVLFENESEMNQESNIKVSNKGNLSLMAFYREDHPEVTILYEHLILTSNFDKFPKETQKSRNILIYLTFIQILFGFLGMTYILYRRSYIYLLVNSIAITLGLFGLYGSMRLHQIILLIHCLFSTSIAGGFFVYQIIEIIYINDTSYGNNTRMNDKNLLLIFSIPYFYDCLVGLYNFYFLNQISKINSESINNDQIIKNQMIEMKRSIPNEEIDKHIQSVDSRKCILCIEKERDTILNPCGHVLGCFECIQQMYNNRLSILSNAKCPICRKKIDSFLKIRFA